MISEILCLLRQKGFDGSHRLLLLFPGGNGGWQIPFLRPVISELSMIAAFDFHNVFRIVNVVFHALVREP